MMYEREISDQLKCFYGSSESLSLYYQTFISQTCDVRPLNRVTYTGGNMFSMTVCVCVCVCVLECLRGI